MTKTEAATAAGGVMRLMSALGLKRQTFYKWSDYPPLRHQHRILTLYPDAQLELTESHQKRGCGHVWPKKPPRAPETPPAGPEAAAIPPQSPPDERAAAPTSRRPRRSYSLG